MTMTMHSRAVFALVVATRMLKLTLTASNNSGSSVLNGAVTMLKSAIYHSPQVRVSCCSIYERVFCAIINDSIDLDAQLFNTPSYIDVGIPIMFLDPTLGCFNFLLSFI